jgi:Gpi18-like mannosyltransferase
MAVVKVKAASRGEPLPARASRLLGRLTPADLAVLRIWLISRAAVLALSWPAMWILQGTSKASRPWLGLWVQWDAARFQAIAQYGYFPPYPHNIPDQVAFLPGFPIALAAVHLLVRQWTITGLLISFVAGGIAMVALGRIADRHYQQGTGRQAVLFLVASPAAIFLAVGYAESLFLALALCSWLAIRSGRWQLALLLAAFATLTRTNGFFLLAALLVEIIRMQGKDRWRALAAFPLALLPIAGYELYLKASTGDWLAWQHAEQAGWYRKFTNPISAFHTTWVAGFEHEFSAPVDFVFQLEIVAVLAGLLATIILLTRRRWPEAVYAGLTIAALATSIWYESVPRALLLLWPVWCGLAVMAKRRPWTGQLYLALAIPISAAIGLLYLTGNWAG